MVSCAECGRSAHPTCLDLADIGDVMRSYDWKCMECKNCEICHSKEDDNRMMFCDFCDRGWHMDCLDPPLSEAPPGKWHCPRCPPLPPPGPSPAAEDQSADPLHDLPLSSPLPMNEPPVASTSRAATTEQPPMVPGESELDVDVIGDGPPHPQRSKKKKSLRWKGKSPMREDPDSRDPNPDLEPTSAPTPVPRRMRLKLSSPVPPPQPSPPPPKTIPIIRLRLPPRGKGKEREEEHDEPPKGIFDNMLSQEDRNTNATSIS
ncbi:hypothetical protein CERSUDRAFT_141605, partial [Gelatoporia subvermispora B]